MKRVIIYGSHYGHSRSYAEKLSSITGIPVFGHKDCPDGLSSMDLIVYVGGLYGGGLLGLSSVLRHLPKCCRPPFIIVTVGLADPDDPQNRASITSAVSRQFGDFMPKKTEFFHLRGGIDSVSYTHLSPIISSLCPLPIGNIESMVSIPVSRGVSTGCLSIISGALASMGR